MRCSRNIIVEGPVEQYTKYIHFLCKILMDHHRNDTKTLFFLSFQETCVQLFSALELTFSIDLSAEEGGGNVELLPNGRDLEVTAANVYSYVRKYSHYRWVKCLAV